jgi:hypothetical protein
MQAPICIGFESVATAYFAKEVGAEIGTYQLSLDLIHQYLLELTLQILLALGA